MRKRLLTIAFTTTCCLSLIIFSACEREEFAYVNPNQIYTEYEFFYSAELDSTYAKATFKLSNTAGSLIQLEGSSLITINGDKMVFDGMFANYEKAYKGFISEGKFSFTNIEGKTFENSIFLFPVEFSDPMETLNKGVAFEMTFSEEPLRPKETAHFALYDILNNDYSLYFQDKTGATTIEISASDTQLIEANTYTCFLERQQISEIINAPDAGGKIKGRYQSVWKTISIR